MDDASDWISLGALVVAVIALGVSVWSARKVNQHKELDLRLQFRDVAAQVIQVAATQPELIERAVISAERVGAAAGIRNAAVIGLIREEARNDRESAEQAQRSMNEMQGKISTADIASLEAALAAAQTTLLHINARKQHYVELLADDEKARDRIWAIHNGFRA